MLYSKMDNILPFVSIAFFPSYHAFLFVKLTCRMWPRAFVTAK
uniref:Uncharacterized protein n=1 Tax=Anguilla anguilla TaxID=7936 RepID=A0A0E9SRR6_ANGAN